MTTFAVTMVRDEADMIGSTVRWMSTQVDHVIVADNNSTDGTRDILADLPVELIHDPDPAYFQSRKMSTLAEWARRCGADWVVPFDADEIWYSPFGRIADVLRAAPDDALIASAELYDHVATGLDPDEPDPVARIGWRRQRPAPLPKVACRAARGLIVHQGNHGAAFPGIEAPATIQGLLVVRHFPYRSAEQVVRKIRNGAAAYAAAGDQLPPDAGAHWRQWGEILHRDGEDAIADLFRKWHWRPDPRVPWSIDGEWQDPLIFDPAPVT